MDNEVQTLEHATAIARVRQWLQEVVIGHNFCPFAKREFDAGRVRYQVFDGRKSKRAIATVLDELRFLDEHEEIETTLLIFADGWRDFYDYLALLDEAQQALEDGGYEGVYQLASFHPDYVFADEAVDDASNYSNRSPLPLLHLLRESSIARAIVSDPNVEQIPERNKQLARAKGAAFWQSLLAKIDS
ncbi:MAG: DUF1415 domain-containing protein [Gammaproteobacteria bacterium]|nr:DUF1415 domain-containing protein [Gammaproteobacteria bacterium]MBQ0840642.1 DUF1415 domain-containing protein [Gammaproteobacteria bacterium]